MPKEIAVIGAGGHAKAVVGAAQMAGLRVVAVYDDNPARWGQSLLGVRISGPVERIREAPLVPTLIGIGDAAVRRKLAVSLPLPWATLIHPASFVHPSAKIGAGTVIFAGVIVQPEVSVGVHAILNANATIAHDSIIEDFVHLAPGVDLAGFVHVEEEAFLGIGAVAIQRITIGARTIVGAGSAVIRDLPRDVIAVGSPARPIKHLDGTPYTGKFEASECFD